MSLFSRATTSPRRGRPIIPHGDRSIAAAIVSRGLYLAAIIGFIMILTAASILAMQLRPYAAPSPKSLTGHSNYPRLVDAAACPGSDTFVGEGGECYGQAA